MIKNSINYEKVYQEFKVNSVHGRYLNLGMIEPILQAEILKNHLEILGYSVEGRPIYACNFGTGKIKILLWSQMHGNESTTTKAVLDFMTVLIGSSEFVEGILMKYTICIIPMLNPDGAEVYTRENANEIDLNRDFQNLSQVESQILMALYTRFQPDLCYNLHDQRTIFGVGSTGKPATISFLAPSFNVSKQYNAERLEAVRVIMNMIQSLNKYIPGQIGRFDDSYNNNCVGDAFQTLGTPTILIEAGHYQEDYDRELTRKFVFIALLATVTSSSENVIVDAVLSDYLNIPQNIPNYFDFIFKNIAINYDKSDLITNFAVQYKEIKIQNKIIFNAYIAKIGNLNDFFGHREYDGAGLSFSDGADNKPTLGDIADFNLGNNVIFVNGLIK